MSHARLRNQGDPDTTRHRRQLNREAVGAHDRIRILHVLVEPTRGPNAGQALAPTHPRHSTKIAHHAQAPRQLRRRHQHPARGREARHHQIAAAGPHDTQRQIGFAPREIADGLARIEQNAQLLVLGDQLIEQRRQHHLGDVGRTGDAHQARGFALESLSEAAEARHALLDLFRDGQKRFGGLGRRNAVATAIEQRRRQRFFERGEPA